MGRKKLKLVVLCATVGTALLAASSASAWTVDMNAQPKLDRTHSWKIEKTVSKSSVTLKKGESTTVSYSVTVGPAGAPVDSNWSVSGTMEMNDDANITVNSVVFTIIPAAPVNTPAIATTQSCVPVTFPVDLGIIGLTCAYSAALPDAADRRARMFATATEDDGTAGVRNAFAPFSFATATVNEVDECVAVTDSMAGALGTVCAADVPKTFTYTRTVGPYSECGSKTVNNTAMYKGSDSGASGTASASVAVTVTCSPPPPPPCKDKKDKDKHGWYGWDKGGHDECDDDDDDCRDKGKKDKDDKYGKSKSGYGGHDDDDCRDHDDDDDCRDKGKKDKDDKDGKSGKHGKDGHDDDDCRDDDRDDHDHDHDDHDRDHDDDKCRGDHKYRDGKGNGWR
jgi:hypothetical protein